MMKQNLYKYFFILVVFFLLSTNIHAITATQSSNYASIYTAGKSIDGNMGTTSITSGATAYDWIVIDLESVRNIGTITVVPRPCCRTRLSNVRIMVSDTPFAQNTTASSLASSQSMADWQSNFGAVGGGSAPISFSPATQGRYILFQKSGLNTTNYLSFVEVQVALAPTPQMGTFSRRHITNLKGNLKVIGNTVLQSPNPTSTNSNSQLNLFYVNIDNSASRYNSSSATINTTEAGVDISNARISWAGLYWQGYLHNDNADTGIDNQFNFSTNNATANTQIPNFIQGQSILLKVGTGSYTSISPTAIGQDRQYNNNNYVSYKYAAFANITTLLQGSSPANIYTVANIPTRSGRTACNVNQFGQCINNRGNAYDGLGNYGAWSLVVVYDNNTSTLEKTRNVTVFDGYTVLSSANNPEQNITLSGFKTPSNAPNGVDSTLSVFAGEGDKNILGDYAKLINQSGQIYNLPNAPGTASYFASAIEGVPTRNPVIANNNGIDIHTTPVGTSTGSGKPIKENQTSAVVSLGTTQDTFMPSMIAFATELFSPELCYDYDVRIGDRIKIPSDNREIHTNRWNNTPLTLTLLIRSELSDFPIDNTKLNVVFSPSTLNYVHHSSQVSPPDVNIYNPIDDIDSALGQIGIGRGATDTTGGTIGALESTFAKQNFTFTSGRFDGTFNINIEGTIQFDPNSPPVPYTLSTSAPANSPNHIARCSTNPVYNPVWSNFNIERSDSTQAQTDEIRYPLYTQIAGKDFNISIVSYTNTGPSGEYDVELDTNATVELELIDASVFDNNASAGYDSTCEEPGAVGNGKFINFAASNGTPQSRVQIRVPQDIPNFNNDVALHSAAFRLWVLSTREANGTKSLVIHNCTKSGDCFEDLYEDRIKSYDTSNTCKAACDTSYTAEGCYTCLRQYFATPICSRDNFSIRPESFRITISDTNESNVTNKQWLTDNSNLRNSNIALAAEYKYAIDVNATLYNLSNNAQSYYNEYFVADDNITNLGSKTINNIIAALEFSDSPSCADVTHRSYGLRLQDGQLDDHSYISHNNVGNYNFWMLDSNWTNVDQPTYPLKTRFGTCIGGSTNPECYDCDILNPSSSTRTNGKLGCVINSNLDTSDTAKNDNYIEIPLRFEPYQFDLSDINISLPNRNNFVYMNNAIDDVLYRDMSVKFIGDLLAVGKNNTLLSNFENGCAAHPVEYDINTTMSEDCSTTIDKYGITTTGTIPKRIHFRRNYRDSSGGNQVSDQNETNASTSLNVLASEFDAGAAEIKLYYNFKRLADSPVNPIQVTFVQQDANSSESNSSTHGLSNYIPKGVQIVQQNVHFLYGRVISDVPTYTVPRTISTTNANLYVEAYCDLPDAECICHSITNVSLRDPSEWRLNNNHNSPTIVNDGTVRLEDQKSPSLLNISPNGIGTPIFINPNPELITIDYIGASAARPYKTDICIEPNNPWFDRSCYGVEFQGGGGWAGTGKTGLILETNASYDSINKRVDW